MNTSSNHNLLYSIAIIVALFVYGLYGYMQYHIHSSVETVIALRATVANEESYKREEQNITSIYEATKDDRARLTSFFVKDSATVSFIEMVENLGDRVGSDVSLSSIESDNLEGKDAGTQGHIKARIDVKGSWASVMRTIMLAEDLPYKVVISGVHLDTSGSIDPKANKRDWHATFTIDAVLVHDVS